MADNWADTVATVLETIAVALERFALLRDRVPADPKRYDSDCAEFVKEAGSLMECLSIIKEIEPFPADDNLRLFLAKLSRSLDGLYTDMQLLSGRVPKELNDFPAAARHLIADSLPDLYTHPDAAWQMMVDRFIALHDSLHGELVTWADRLRTLPVPDDAEPDLSDVLQGMDDEHCLPLPELARQLAALADDVEAASYVPDPLRHNAADLLKAARLQFRDTSMDRREVEPGRWQWFKRDTRNRPLDERRLEHHLCQALAVLSDLQDGRKAADAATKLRAIAKGIEQAAPRPADPESPDAPADTGVDDLVNLDEAAAIVHRSKRTLERLLSKMPAPYVQGGGGKPSLWKWAELRPWLEKEFVPDLPKRFPRNVR